MGHGFYLHEGNKIRVDMIMGDGATGTTIVPGTRDENGDEISIPRFEDLVLNLCKYSFSMNSIKSASHFINGSDLDTGHLTFDAPAGSSGSVSTVNKVKSITNDLGDRILESVGNVTTVHSTNLLDTTKGVYHLNKVSNQAGFGIRIPVEKALLQNTGDSFFLSMAFGFNNATIWGDILQIAEDLSSRNSDGYLRVEVGNRNALHMYNYQDASTTADIDISGRTANQDKVLILMFNIRRVQDSSGTDLLRADVWYNGVKRHSDVQIGIMKGGPKNLFCFNSEQTGNRRFTNMWMFSFRVWGHELTDDEANMVHKLELRNLGLDSIPPEGTNIYTYLQR